MTSDAETSTAMIQIARAVRGALNGGPLLTPAG